MASIPLGRYLWERIHQIGVDTVFGVPGDFNLQFLDYIYQVKGLQWVGNQNELNAVYAADGYARIKGAPGVFVTTHGVGELSALNGVAGAMSEEVKLIHVVGQTTRAMQDNHMMIHHSIGEKPDHQIYNRASRDFRVAAAELWDIKTAPAEIDRVIRECFIQSKPVYIFLPLDLSMEEVPASLLDTPLDLNPPISKSPLQAAVNAIKDLLNISRSPCLLIDALVQRHNAVEEARQLVEKLQVPFYSTNMAKGLVDETHPKYVGLYNGLISAPGVATAIEASDLVIVLGYLPADTNSGGFSRKLVKENMAFVHPHSVVIPRYDHNHSGIAIKPLLAKLYSEIAGNSPDKYPQPKLPPPLRPQDLDAKHITQSWLWPRLSAFFQPGDVIIGETGTTVFGLCDIKFPADIRFFAQIYYGSIGYAFASTLGASIARHSLSPTSGRTILITGDGSMAMTIQEIGTMIKTGQNPTVFVINNSGYTVERLIWGAKMSYNDIVPTDYSLLLGLFKHPTPEKSFFKAETKEELEGVLGKLEEGQDVLTLVEVVVPMMDTAWRLGAQIASRGEDARKRLDREGFVDALGNWGLGEDGVRGEGAVKWA